MPMFRQHVLLRACAAAVAAIIGYGVFAALAAEPAAAPTSSDLSADPSSVDLMEWLKSEEVGGYISPKVTYGVGPTESSTGSSAPARADYGHRNSGSSTSLSGMYALAPISKGEAIITVPSTYVITSGPDRASYERQDMCATARNLARERRNGSNSKWAPYVSYCFDSFPHEHLPSNWSKDALSLFNVIVGYELPPQNIREKGSYRYMCLGGNTDDDDVGFDDDGFDVDDEDEHISNTARTEGNEDFKEEEVDEVLEAAFRIVTARGWRGTLLPVIDMFNHRNGEFHNIDIDDVDQEISAHEGKDVTLVALRDIQAGEQLYISYNECNDLDCASIAHTYTTPQIFADYCFVEQYPRRFNLNVDIVFELDMHDQGGGLELEWLDDEPDHQYLNWFHAHLQRLRQLNQTVVEALKRLEHHEQFPIRSFYDALVVALEEAAAWNPSDEDEEKGSLHDCKVDADGTTQCTVVAEDIYDPLNARPDTAYESFHTCFNVYDTYGASFSSDGTNSFYQNIEIRHYKDSDGKKVDTCLLLGFELHSCTSCRPHYHENVVHYPAQFVSQIKRVLFLGGGDSMILHEVLKYESLELVVGLELDPVVVRKSFQHFRTEPHFDDDRVQWWFGDASKSLRMLPDSYLGSFDLVIVDLLSRVADTLMVTFELSILDYSMLFLNQGGVLSLHDDSIVPSEGRNALFGVDLIFTDVPVFCEWSINMLSNSVDFLKAEPVDHGIESLVFRPGSALKFHSWWNYWNNTHRPKLRKEALTNGASDHTRTSTSSEGVMVVLEAEGVVAMNTSPSSLLENGNALYDSVSHALQDVGLTVLSSSSFKVDVLFIALREGYVVLRTWPEHNYCAFDLMLWSNREMDNTISAMATAVGAELSSSYRIVMSGGMSGVDAAETTKYPAAAAGEKSSDASIIDYGPDAASSNLPFGSNDLNDEILVEMIASMLVKHKSTFVAVVLCPNDTPSSCQSLKVLEENSGAIKYKKVVALYDCSFDAPPAPSRNVACEEATREVLISTAKIDTIIIDPQVPRRMGQILHKVLQYSKTRRAVLADNYLVLAASLELNPSDLWRQALLERFRTDITIFSISHHAEIFFRRSDGSHLLQVGIFSSGRADFLSRLAKGIEECEFETGIISEIQYVRDGMPKYIPDFEPSMVATDPDYDRTAYDEHWKNQNPLGMQTISQFEARPLLSPVAVGERVLAQFFYDGVPGEWYPANIEATNNDGTYDVTYLNDERDNKGSGLARDFIRKWEGPSDLSVSEVVLVKLLGERSLYVGKVVESFPDKTYKIRAHTGSTRETTIVKQKNLIRRFEKPEKEPDIAAISCTALKETMQNAATAYTAREEIIDVSIHGGAGDGCIIAAFWSHGNAVATWDGEKHINLNLFTFEESTQKHRLFADSLAKAFPSFSLVSLNEQPRGSGRVVSFKEEIDLVAEQ